MDFENLSDLPEWDDEEFDRLDESTKGESWKPDFTRSASKALYQQWQQVMIVLQGVLETMNTEQRPDGFPSGYWEDHKAMLLGDAYQVGVKIKSAEAGDLYMIRMENATIIRKNAQFIKSSMLSMIAEKVIEKDHGYVIREEIDKFRLLFKKWVASFQKDEFEDEWGLFV